MVSFQDGLLLHPLGLRQKPGRVKQRPCGLFLLPAGPWLMADSASPKPDRDKCTVVVGQSASLSFSTLASPKYRRMAFLRLKNYSQPSRSRLLCRRSAPLCRSVCLLDMCISSALIKAFLQLLILSAPICSIRDFSTDTRQCSRSFLPLNSFNRQRK